MARRGLREVTVSNFRGPMRSPGVELTDIPPEYLSRAENVSFFDGFVRTREGYGVKVRDFGQVVKSFASWRDSGNDVLIGLLADNSVKAWYQTQGNTETVFAAGAYTGDSMQVATAGPRIYVANGAGSAWVWDGLFTNANSRLAPLAVAPPNVTSITAAATLTTGSCTAGTHKFAVAFVTVSGYTTRPSATFTATLTGGKVNTVSVTVPSVPTYIDYAILLMTTVNNQAQYYIAPVSSWMFAGLGGTNVTMTFSVDVSDDSLAATATDAGDLFLKADGTQIAPLAISAYGTRMAYIAAANAFFSEPLDYETVYVDTSRVDLPGRKRLTAGFPLRGSFFLCADDSIYSIVDTGEDPAAWGAPSLVSSSIGVAGQGCVDASADTGVCVIAARGGLYWFDGGAFATQPLNRFQLSDWRRINWQAGSAVRVLNDVENSRIYVAVPLDGATACSHVMVFDYQAGTVPEAIRYSLDALATGSVSDLRRVWDATVKRYSVGVCGPSTGGVLRRVLPGEAEAAGYGAQVDGTLSFESLVETSVIPGDVPLSHHRGASLRILGSGSATIELVGIDSGVVRVGRTVPLESAPGGYTALRFFEATGGVRYRVRAASTGTMILSEITHYWKPYLQVA